MGLIHELRRILWKAGIDISRITPSSHPLGRKKQIFASYAIDTVLDIGANTGQFAEHLRHDLGYTGRIFSFEPQSRVFEELKANAEGDARWKVYKWALGEAASTAEINISRNSLGSSLLTVLPTFLKSAPNAVCVGKEVIQVKPLDSFFSDYCTTENNVYLKIDTQGFESRVLKGAERSLPQIDTVQMEMSLVPLYQDELLIHDMCTLMAGKGYTLVSLEGVFADSRSGQLMQVDGIFHRF
jgi:FkbM family methyltransferase